jgi:hypothetical protein
MSQFPVQPIGSLLFVEPAQLESTVAVVVDPRSSWRGKVLAKGPDAKEVAVNDMVRMKPTQAIDAVFHQRRVWVVREEDVLAVEDAAA